LHRSFFLLLILAAGLSEYNLLFVSAQAGLVLFTGPLFFAVVLFLAAPAFYGSALIQKKYSVFFFSVRSIFTFVRVHLSLSLTAVLISLNILQDNLQPKCCRDSHYLVFSILIFGHCLFVLVLLQVLQYPFILPAGCVSGTDP
jgi:hypothetical protein